MLTAKEIRETFKRYFEEHGHHIVPSAPMVIKDHAPFTARHFMASGSTRRPSTR